MTSVLVSATRNDSDQFHANTLLGRSLKQQQHQHWQCMITTNNAAPLATVYNDAIHHSDPQSLIVFCHDDVWLGEVDLIPILQTALNHYDVVGVAGNRRCQPGQIAWWVDPTNNKRDNDHLVGKVDHGTPVQKFINHAVCVWCKYLRLRLCNRYLYRNLMLLNCLCYLMDWYLRLGFHQAQKFQM